MKKKVVKYALYMYKKQTENFVQTVDLVARCNARCWFKNYATDPVFSSNDEIDQINNQPDIFIVIYNEMYDRFQAVGDVCYLSLLNFRLKGTTAVNKQWDILTLTGLTLNYIMEPFSFAYL
jgi:hypothetical protein